MVQETIGKQKLAMGNKLLRRENNPFRPDDRTIISTQKTKIMKTINSILTVGLVILNFSNSKAQKGELTFNDTRDFKETNNSLNVQRVEFYAPDTVEIYRPKEPKAFNHAFGFSTSYSMMTHRTNLLLANYDDTSSLRFEGLNVTPSFSFSQEFYFDKTFSLSYSLGYMKNNLAIGGKVLNSKHAYLFVRPRLNVYKCQWLQAYVQINLGLVYNDFDMTKIESEIVARQLPPNLKFYTGFTPIGLNFRLSDRIWTSLECSLWSFETVNVGIKFKLGKNENYFEGEPVY